MRLRIIPGTWRGSIFYGTVTLVINGRDVTAAAERYPSMPDVTYVLGFVGRYSLDKHAWPASVRFDNATGELSKVVSGRFPGGRYSSQLMKLDNLISYEPELYASLER